MPFTAREDISVQQLSPCHLSEAVVSWAANHDGLDPARTRVSSWFVHHPDGLESRRDASVVEVAALIAFPPNGEISLSTYPHDAIESISVSADTSDTRPTTIKLTIRAHTRGWAHDFLDHLKSTAAHMGGIGAPIAAVPATEVAEAVPGMAAVTVPSYSTELSTGLPMLTLDSESARRLWRAVCEPGPGMHMTRATIRVGSGKRDYSFDDIDAVLSSAELPTVLRDVTMHAFFAPDGDHYGTGDRVWLSLATKPVLSVSGTSELWANGKLAQVKSTARLMRSPIAWTRPWRYGNALILLPTVASYAVLFGREALVESGANATWIDGLSVFLVLLIVFGVLDAFWLKLTHSCIRRTATSPWSRSDMFAFGTLAVTILGVVIAAMGVLLTSGQ